jgi:hypothetical protein
VQVLVQSGARWGAGARECPAALDALGGQLAPHWHGWGVAHARSRAGVAQGIVRGCTERLKGEVIVREAVGAGLLMLGVHGGVSAMSWAAWGVLGRSL